MKIAISGGSNEFVDNLDSRLRQAFADEPILDWRPKTEPPAPDIEVLVSVGPVTREMMTMQPRLKLIQTASDGYDAVDVDAATELGIFVAYTPGQASGNADSVAEYAVMLLIAANRRVSQALRFISDHNEPRPMLTHSLVGRTVCIYGFGDIGQRVATRLKPFGPRLIALNRDPSKVGDADVQAFSTEQRKQALQIADAVVLCVRGSAENRHLVDAAFLAEMKKGATLVNIARGSLVDEAALAEALQSGHLGAAGLDVQEHEPVAPNDPLLGIATAFLTPHIAGFTQHTLEGTVNYVVQVVNDFRAGHLPKALVNKPRSPRMILPG